jgi:hypothetical protein
MVQIPHNDVGTQLDQLVCALTEFSCQHPHRAALVTQAAHHMLAGVAVPAGRADHQNRVGRYF